MLIVFSSLEPFVKLSSPHLPAWIFLRSLLAIPDLFTILDFLIEHPRVRKETLGLYFALGMEGGTISNGDSITTTISEFLR